MPTIATPATGSAPPAPGSMRTSPKPVELNSLLELINDAQQRAGTAPQA